MAKKKTFEEVKNIIEQDGEYKLLSTEYINNKDKLLVKHISEDCNNNEYLVKLNVFSNGRRCPICSKIKSSKKRSISEEQFKELLEKSDNDLTMIDKYVSYSEKINFFCNKCNNIWNTAPVNTIRYKCGHCQGNLKKDTKMFKNEVESITSNEYTIIGEYVTTGDYVKFKHLKCGRDFNMIPKNFISCGNRCPHCNNDHKRERTNSIKSKYLNDFLIKLKNDGYSIDVNDYINFKSSINIKHDICGTIINRRPEYFMREYGSRCPKCFPMNRSSAEIELCEYIKSIYSGTVIESDKKLLNGKELDIYLPDLNVAIEFDGLYWHSDLHERIDRNYHLNKTNECAAVGVRLIHIFEDEWLESKEIVMSKIRSILKININLKKAYARKCYIEEIDTPTKNQFLNINHIQKADKSNIKLGLWLPCEDGDELISVMTFVKPRISLGQTTKKYDYELSRFATDIEYIAPGAFSKLFAYFKKNYEWNKIITYADKRYSIGNLYIVNGFTQLKDSKPNYWYTDTNKKYHRFGFRKSVLKDKFPTLYKESLTEFEIMDSTNYTRIWDCGNMVFEYIK